MYFIKSTIRSELFSVNVYRVTFSSRCFSLPLLPSSVFSSFVLSLLCKFKHLLYSILYLYQPNRRERSETSHPTIYDRTEDPVVDQIEIELDGLTFEQGTKFHSGPETEVNSLGGR